MRARQRGSPEEHNLAIHERTKVREQMADEVITLDLSVIDAEVTHHRVSIIRRQHQPSPLPHEAV